MEILNVFGYELIDSRGNPTVGAKVELSDGSTGFAISPSGASTGVYEAHELRDNDKLRYCGKGVKTAVDNINGSIAQTLKGVNGLHQRKVDETLIKLDNTENKSNLGANAILAVSMATAKAAANSKKLPLYRYLGGINANTLPRPMMNILNGGAHASNNIDIQEFMIVPTNFCCFAEALRKCCEVYHTLGQILKAEGLSVGVGDEGGFAPNLESDEMAIQYIIKAIERAGYSTDDIKISLDAASSEWYSGGGYNLPKRNKSFTADALIDYYDELVSKYPIISLEDGVGEDDLDGWKKLTDRLGRKLQLVGDDLFVTNSNRLKIGIEKGIGNSILVKPNQIGTVTQTLDVIRLAQRSGYTTVISHRSGESEDTTIADIAVAVNAGQIKTGAPCRSDRTSKYNRLLFIENELCTNC